MAAIVNPETFEEGTHEHEHPDVWLMAKGDLLVRERGGLMNEEVA